MKTEDSRATLMLDWLKNDLALPVAHYAPASSDASFRRYFRIQTGRESFIVMDAPPDKENIGAFIKVASVLADSRIHVPAIYRINPTDGFLLLEDFGSTSFLDSLKPSTADRLYQSALDSLFQQQTQIDIESVEVPRYDQTLLTRELKIFEEWFAEQYLDITIPEALSFEISQLLIESALDQPLTFVHRDYHSRNLMDLGSDKPGVLDFQDAVIGPITYDLVSLLKDCYISWPEPQIEQWRNRYFQRLHRHGSIACSQEQFKRWFDLMGLQRHLKAIGIFARLHLRDGKSIYLNDIPRTMDYVTDTCARYTELSDFSEFLNGHILPTYRKAA